MKLRGIGEKRAESIISYRDENAFKELVDLSNIGLSQKQITKIAEQNM